MADALFIRTQRRVRALLYGQPQRHFGVKELIAATDASSGALQRKLADAGLLSVQYR